MMHRLVLLLFSITLAAPMGAGAQQPPPPSPAEVLGNTPGDPGWIAEWSEIRRYFGELGGASDLVAVEPIGESVEGRPMIMAVITSPENHGRLDEIRRDQARLADPRGLSGSDREALIARQPAVVFIGASLHGNEIMGTQMSMQLAHELAADAELREALEEVVVLLVPSMNPDGLDITRSWWLRIRGTEYADARMPWMYHHYVGHDNNRDFYMVTQPETEAVTRQLYERWFPEVVFDVHQMGNRGARFFIPPFDDPLNPNVDPLIVRMTNVIGTQMALDLTERGKTGVQHAATFDLWWHGGGRTVPARHNMVGILSEAASAYYGDPIQQSPDELEQPQTGSMFPEPWEGGAWTPRDIVEYELIAAKSLVRLMQRQREDFVRNFTELAAKQVRRGEEGGPFAYVVPRDQWDPGSAAEMLRVLRKGGVEVHEASSEFVAGGETYPAGTRVVLMAQPFRAHAKDLLEPQEYPDIRQYPDGPPDVPYDVAGWTLPFAMGVQAIAVDQPFDTDPLVRVNEVDVPAAEVIESGSGGAYALDPRLNNTHRAVHEALREGGEVAFLEAPLLAGGAEWPAGGEWPAGAPIISGLPDLEERARRWASELGVTAVAVAPADEGPTLRNLRVALYKPWTASMDEGWTRWVFEQWGVPFDSIRDDEIRGGDLDERFDVIVVPDVSYEQMIEGLDPAENPPEYAGGLGMEGAIQLGEFVRGGGTLVLLDSSSEFAIRELDVPVRDVAAAQDRDATDRWYAPGSLLRVRWDPTHPLAYGMPEESAVYYAHSPVFEVAPGAENVTIVAEYPDSGLLLSGYAQNEAIAAGHAALVEAEVGEGRVIMFGFRPQHRAQPHETFKVLFNALYRR